MSEIYLTLAEGFEKIAAGYRALASNSTEEKTAATTEENQISIEDVRAVLALKSQEGKTREVKALLMKYDAGKLSGVKPEDYASLLKEAEVL